MRRTFHRLAFSVLALALALGGTPAGAISLPPEFVAENAVPGIMFDTPTAIAFLPSGRMLVAEKRGRVWAVSNGIREATPLWSRESEVLNITDCGLLSIAVDPAYTSNHYIYLLYTVDADTNGVDDNDEGFGRLTRYTVSFSDSNLLIPSSRAILFGASWGEGPCVGNGTHTIGDLQWGADGSLLVSAGDGANVFNPDWGGRDPGMFIPGRTNPVENIGAFRSQYIGSLAGKVLRLDPATGHGYPSNPYWDGNPRSVQSRVWCYGLRNPFRFTFRPGTGVANPAAGNPGTIYLGDVGWNLWEEQNVAPTGARNFGWPCYEGLPPTFGYFNANPIHHSCDSIGLGDNTGLLTRPAIAYHHFNPALSTPPGLSGNTAIAGVFYTAANYPALYQGRYFFGDFGQNWIKFAQMNAADSVLSIIDLATDAAGPVDIANDPLTGDLIYVAILVGEVRRIRFTGTVGGNHLPIVRASGQPLSGVAPVVVDFSSAGTYDPDLDPLALSWNFGDGVGSNLANPGHIYLTNGSYAAVLTADDGRGGLVRDTVEVHVFGGAGPFPSTPLRDDFNRPNGPLGPAWAGQTTGGIVRNGAASTACCNPHPVWSGQSFGPDQEAFFTFSTLQPQHHALLLKVQGTDWTAGSVQVSYHRGADLVLVSTYTPGQGSFGRGEFPESFLTGDQLGVRAWSNGSVELFKNGVLFGAASIADWPFVGAGGRIGFYLESTLPARIDDFGGGTIVLNTEPTATILTPANNSFFAPGDVLLLSGRARDIESPPDSIDFEWRVDLHHNTHVHPGVFVATGDHVNFPIENHDDGTGVWYEIRLRVEDHLGLADTTSISILPEVDLQPGWLRVTPENPGNNAPAEYRFWMRNLGRASAKPSRWRLIAGQAMLAEGEVQVSPLDSVEVVLNLPPVLDPGIHTLRVAADTLDTLVELNEQNNASTRQVLAVEGPGSVGTPSPELPRTLALSNAYPSPSRGEVSFRLDLPRAARVGLAVHDLQGRRVWSLAEHTRDPGRWTLAWDGRRESGGSAPAGLYLARITVDGHTFVRRIARVR